MLSPPLLPPGTTLQLVEDSDSEPEDLSSPQSLDPGTLEAAENTSSPGTDHGSSVPIVVDHSGTVMMRIITDNMAHVPDGGR